MDHVTHAVSFALQVDRDALHPRVLIPATMLFILLFSSRESELFSNMPLWDEKLEPKILMLYLLSSSLVKQQNQASLED